MAGRRMWHTCLPPRRATRRVCFGTLQKTEVPLKLGTLGEKHGQPRLPREALRQLVNSNLWNKTRLIIIIQRILQREERERQASLLVFFFFFFTDWGTRTGAVGEWWVLQTKQKATLARRLIINSENSNHKFFREKRQVSLWIFTDWDARAGARVVGKLILQNVLGTAEGRVKHQCWGVLQLVRSSKSPPGRGAFYEPCTMTSHHSVLPSVRSATLSREAFLFNMRLILNSENFQCHK